MALRKIVSFPDPVLRKRSLPVNSIDNEILRLLDDMAETMYAAPGVGLAAPQVGVNLRVCVIDVSERQEEAAALGLIELINPVIVSSSGMLYEEEGCLSIPGFTSEVKRRARALVRARNRLGETIEIEGGELLARALQHEIDHLDGVLFIDRLSKLKRELMRKKIEKVLGKEGGYAAF
ncbi:MAG: peptide deformylase [Deltaproteobacteria bacterium]